MCPPVVTGWPVVTRLWPSMGSLWASSGPSVGTASGLGARWSHIGHVVGQHWALCGLRLTMTVLDGQPWPVSDLSVARSGFVVGRFWPRHRKKKRPGRSWVASGSFVTSLWPGSDHGSLGSISIILLCGHYVPTICPQVGHLWACRDLLHRASRVAALLVTTAGSPTETLTGCGCRRTARSIGGTSS